MTQRKEDFMNRKILLVLASLIIIVFVCEAHALPRLTVRKFENKTGESGVPIDAITDMMTSELSKANIFNLLERENINYVTDEIAFGQSGLVDSSTAPQIGKIKGAQYTLTGATTLYRYNEKGGGAFIKVIGGVMASKTAYVVLDIRVIDNTTGEIIYTDTQEGSAKNEIAGGAAYYKGFFLGGGKVSHGGILAAATRDAVVKIVNEMKRYEWD